MGTQTDLRPQHDLRDTASRTPAELAAICVLLLCILVAIAAQMFLSRNGPA